jgi:hypothetical protein
MTKLLLTKIFCSSDKVLAGNDRTILGSRVAAFGRDFYFGVTLARLILLGNNF